MGPGVVVVGGVVAAALFALGARLDREASLPGDRTLRHHHVLPWSAGAMILVGSLMAAGPEASPVVMLGLLLYAGFAAAALWRMATLDRASVWLAPSRRRARFTISVAGLAWLGVVLGLLLWIADLLAGYTAGA